MLCWRSSTAKGANSRASAAVGGAGCQDAGIFGRRLAQLRASDYVGGMKLEEFRTSLSRDKPPQDLGLALQALWWEAKGDWDKAHECAQAKEDDAGCWVHAYLHRREGGGDN